MQESFNKWFFSKARVFDKKEDNNKETKVEIQSPQKKRKPQKYVNRRVARTCR